MVKRLELLLVEDNQGDVVLVREALKASPIQVSLHVVTDGEEALAFIRQQGPYTQAAQPDLILLDLNLPKQNGRAVLTAMHADPALKSIPVAVLTSSDKRQDIMDSYALGANCYLQKPMELEAYFTLIQTLVNFWARHVTLLPR